VALLALEEAGGGSSADLDASGLFGAESVAAEIVAPTDACQRQRGRDRHKQRFSEEEAAQTGASRACKKAVLEILLLTAQNGHSCC